jgi:hypothetical protein
MTVPTPRARRRLGRALVGGAFLVGAGIHVGVAGRSPPAYTHFADGALLPAVRTAWAGVLMANPPLWGLVVAAAGPGRGRRCRLAHRRRSGAPDPATPGVELLAGIVHDPLFGSLVTVGLGGVHTDLLGDRTYRLPPLTDVDAAAIWQGLRAARLLTGDRGSEPVDIAALEELLLRLARLADDVPEVAELDLNPVRARPDGVRPRAAQAPGRPATPAGPPRQP